jgi:hypothetical protein
MTEPSDGLLAVIVRKIIARSRTRIRSDHWIISWLTRNVIPIQNREISNWWSTVGRWMSSSNTWTRMRNCHYDNLIWNCWYCSRYLHSPILNQLISLSIHIENHPIAVIEVSSGTAFHPSNVGHIPEIQRICIPFRNIAWIHFPWYCYPSFSIPSPYRRHHPKYHWP